MQRTMAVFVPLPLFRKYLALYEPMRSYAPRIRISVFTCGSYEIRERWSGGCSRPSIIVRCHAWMVSWPWRPRPLVISRTDNADQPHATRDDRR